ncbi:MAG: histidine kinase [Bacteroidota bacterium]
MPSTPPPDPPTGAWAGPRRSTLLFWILQTGGWSLYGSLSLLLFRSAQVLDGRAAAGVAITYLVGFLVSLGLRSLYRRVRAVPRSFATVGLAVLASVLAGSQIWYWSDALLTHLSLGGEFSRYVPTPLRYAGTVYSLSFVLFTWSALYFGIHLWRDWHMEKERTEKARLLAESAQLQMLRYQINPHFLFNALNSIRALVDDDREKARAMVTALSDFLRYTLDNAGESCVPLRQEMEAVRRYFEIQRIRYEEKLAVDLVLAPRAEAFPVPGFLVHPLVENAVKYGMRTSPMPLRIRVEASTENGALRITVWNSGRWVNPPDAGDPGDGTHTGLINIRRRLEHSYPSRHRLEVEEAHGGVLATVAIYPDQGAAA